MKIPKTNLLAVACGGVLALTQLFTALPPATASNANLNPRDPFVYDDPAESPSCEAMKIKDCEICWLTDAEYYSDGRPPKCEYWCEPRDDKEDCKEQLDTNGWDDSHGFYP